MMANPDQKCLGRWCDLPKSHAWSDAFESGYCEATASWAKRRKRASGASPPPQQASVPLDLREVADVASDRSKSREKPGWWTRRARHKNEEGGTWSPLLLSPRKSNINSAATFSAFKSTLNIVPWPSYSWGPRGFDITFPLCPQASTTGDGADFGWKELDKPDD